MLYGNLKYLTFKCLAYSPVFKSALSGSEKIPFKQV